MGDFFTGDAFLAGDFLMALVFLVADETFLAIAFLGDFLGLYFLVTFLFSILILLIES